MFSNPVTSSRDHMPINGVLMVITARYSALNSGFSCELIG